MRPILNTTQRFVQNTPMDMDRRLILLEVNQKSYGRQIHFSNLFGGLIEEVFGEEFDLIHDPFHVVALVSKAIDETRRELVRKAEEGEKKVIKGSRFLLYCQKGTMSKIHAHHFVSEGRGDFGVLMDAVAPKKPLAGTEDESE